MDRLLYELLANSLRPYGPVQVEWSILPFLANILLVLKCGRPAFLIGSNTNELTMLKAILPMSDLTSFETRYGPLILRKEKKVEIEEIFSRPGVDIHLEYARVLGYDYQKEDWCEGDSYGITYHFRYQGIKSRLYTFRVPVTAYDDALRARVEEKVALFNSLLKEFDFVFYSGSELFLDS